MDTISYHRCLNMCVHMMCTTYTRVSDSKFKIQNIFFLLIACTSFCVSQVYAGTFEKVGFLFFFLFFLFFFFFFFSTNPLISFRNSFSLSLSSFWISHTTITECKLGISFSNHRRVNDFHDTVFTAPLAKLQSGCRGMCNDVATNWFVGIC